MITQLQMKSLDLRAGDKLEVKGFILQNADRFQIDLGRDVDNRALHFNPRYHDETDGAVLVCNSNSAGNWGEEKRITPNPLRRGTDVKIVVKLCGSVFEVELPDGQEVHFPNRDGMDVISFIRIEGDLKMTSFKIFK